MIKTNNEGEEVFVLLFPRRITNTCFGSVVVRVSKVRLFIREKIRLVSRHTIKRRTTNKKNGEKNVSTNSFRVWRRFKVWEYYLSTTAVLSQYYPFGRSKYSTAQTTLRQL